MQKDNFILFCPFHKTYYNLLPGLICPGARTNLWHVCCPDCGSSNIKGKFTDPDEAIYDWNESVRKILSQSSFTRGSNPNVVIPTSQIFVIMEIGFNKSRENMNCYLPWYLDKEAAIKESKFHDPNTINLEVFSPDCLWIGPLPSHKDTFWFVFEKSDNSFNGHLTWFKTRREAREYVMGKKEVSSPTKWTYSYTVGEIQ